MRWECIYLGAPNRLGIIKVTMPSQFAKMKLLSKFRKVIMFPFSKLSSDACFMSMSLLDLKL